MTTQSALFTQPNLLVENRQFRKRIIMLLQNFGTLNFCKTRYVEGKPSGSGCGREVYFATFKNGRVKCLNEDASFHVCPEVIKP